MESNPLDPVASEPLSHAGQVFTSDLSINEFALLHGAGFEPIELVMGVSVYHVGYQFTGIRQQSELAVLTDATYRRLRTRRSTTGRRRRLQLLELALTRIWPCVRRCFIERHLRKLKVKPRGGEEVETPGVRCRAGRFAGSGGVGRGIC